MARTSPNEIKRQQIEIIARLSASQTRLVAALEALRDAQPGYPTATGGGGSPRLDEAGNPPGLDRYIDRADPAAHDLHQLVTKTSQMLNAACVVLDIVTRWGVASDARQIEGGGRVRQAVSGGDCVACGAFCSGAHNDRLRSGLCMSCYQDMRRSTLERGEWMLERRRSLQLANESDVA